MSQVDLLSTITDELRERILSELPCGLCVAKRDERLTIVFANVNFYRTFGYADADAARAEGVVGALDCMDEEAKQATADQMEKMTENEESTAAFEVRIRRKDGGVYWSLVRIHQADFGSGIWICAFMDISAQKIVEEELRMREEEYRIAVRQSDKFVIRFDIEKNVAYLPSDSVELFHREAVTDLPYSLEEMGVVNADSLETYRDLYEQIITGRRPAGNAILQLRLGSADGPYEWYRVAYSLIYREKHVPAQAVVSLQNISEQHAKEVAYQRWEQTYEAMAQDNTAYLEFDLTQNRLEVQKGALIEALPVVWGETMEHVLRCFLDQYVHPDDHERIRAFIAREHLLTEYFRGKKLIKPEYRHLLTDGRYGWVRLSVQMLPDPYSSNIRVSFLLRDIDAQKQQEITLKDQLRTDALTGALNRVAFIEAVEALISETRGSGLHALVMVDVDHFKQINDRFGHNYGDRVLVRIGGALRAALRTDDLVGRIGGDEFVILLKNIPSNNALVSKINSLCEQLCQRVSSEIVVSCSFGAATCPLDGETFNELYCKADIALYAAKEAGRNCARVYEVDMDRPVTLFDGVEIS